jgi:hypothetical protein
MTDFSNEENFFSTKENEFDETNEFDDPLKLPKIVELDHPVQHGKTLVEKIEFKYQLTAKAMQTIPIDSTNQKIGHMLPLIAAMTDYPLSVIQGLSTLDLSKCLRVLGPFLNVLQE